MYTLITDETNTQESKNSEFFIYGGLVFSPEQMGIISSDIQAIRDTYGFAPEDKLKFDTNSRPANVDRSSYTAAKKQVIQSCLNAGVVFIAYMILHKIAKDPKTIGEYALNSVLVRFDGVFLREKSDIGVVIVDRLPDQARAYDMLRRKFQTGLEIASNGSKIELDRVLLYATTCDGASHLSSAVDIVLGSLRWVVNHSNNGPTTELSRDMFGSVASMMYHRESGGKKYLRDYGLILRPKEPGHPPYKARYDDLVSYLQGLLNS
ncbi:MULTISPECIES: DUF3800 domain-containing protein [Amycolatopsis]|uniref:DUF3800 domain-containing protein n=1 Tax=Amycolatopsis TaxID=1813 RepID=UPI001178B2B8|nr:MULTISPECIES: DUF3800 domain-containing protein [Amycolatopsis]